MYLKHGGCADRGKPQEKLERLIGILRGFAGEEVVKMIVLDSWRYLVNTFLGYNENSFVDCTLVWDAVRAVCKEEKIIDTILLED